MSKAFIDLYSDTKTLPSAGMRAAMAQAEVGDEQADEDPSTLALISKMCTLLNMPAGLFLPSGSMCNLVAILSHTRPGDEVICDEQAHIYGTEAAGAAALAGVSIRPISCIHGLFSKDDLLVAVRDKSRTAPRSSLVSIEQTTNFSGGAIWPLAQMREVRDAAHSLGMKAHIDGARLLNACAATGIGAADYAQGWDSVWIDLSKGLGCPVGAVLCGSVDFIEAAAQWKYRLGGAMRQSGILAAAGLYALEHNVDRLKIDHDNARLIWRGLAGDPLFQFDPAEPVSNILRFHFDPLRINASEFAVACLEQGVRVRAMPGNFIRVTTHLDVSGSDAETAVAVMANVAGELLNRGHHAA